MRIVHVDTGQEMRGGQRQVLLLIEDLQKIGHGCRLLAIPGSPLWLAAEERRFDLAAVSLLALRGAAQQADLVHAHDARSHTLAAIAGRKPLMVSRRVAFPLKLGPFSRWKYQRADCFLAVSQFVSRELQKGGVPRGKIELVYDAVEIKPLPAEPLTVNARAVTLASNDPRKGRDLASRAADLAHVTMIFSDDLERDLRSAGQFVYLTRSEGLGSAALLAMSFGLPVIASRVGGLPEVVVDGETGLLVENEPTVIAAAMRRLADDRPFATTLGQNGRQRVEQFFGRQQMLDGTLRAYAKVLAPA